MSGEDTIGFIGLGVMGEPICANLAAKCGRAVVATDLRPEPLERLAAAGVEACADVAAVAARAGTVFLSLPGGVEVAAVARELLGHSRLGRVIVDLSTAPVDMTRALAAEAAEAGVGYADAPVARTRAAARAGTLSVMVGAETALYRRIEPLIRCFAAEITHCGPPGAGQVVKLLNNMVLFQSVAALAEALTIARRAGLDGRRTFEALSKGSADSFALRNHGMKVLLADAFPTDAFPTAYARKDLGYALERAREAGVATPAARITQDLLARTAAAGHDDAYFPVLLKVIEAEAGAGDT